MKFNKEYIKNKNKQWREINGKEQDKKDYQKRKNDPNYKVKHNEYRLNYEKNKRAVNINFKLKQNISRRIREFIKNKQNTTK